MNDRPTATELVDAVRQYLETDLLPTLTDARLRFQTLIAANVLAIVGRELQTEEAQLLDEWALLTRLLGRSEPVPPRLSELRRSVLERNRALCERIRAGEYDESSRFRELARQLRGTVVKKLMTANPRYLSAV
jgi:hypothetical protein